MSLVNSSFAVNVTPGAMPPTVHVSEYDIGRTYTVTINGQNGSTFNIPAGTTATVVGTLNGVIGFTTDATISGSTVSFALTESMTARSGKAWCKIKLTLNDESIQTRAFVLAVDRAGVEAETVIGADGFDTQIQNAVDNYLDEHPVGVEVDPTLTISGAAADAKVTGDEIGDLRSALDEAIEDFAVPTQEAVNNWLNAHPEATTTVQDGSITEAKFSSAVKEQFDAIQLNGDTLDGIAGVTWGKTVLPWEDGDIGSSGQDKTGSDLKRTAGYIEAQKINVKMNGASNLYWYWYDANHAFLGERSSNADRVIDPADIPNAAYIRFVTRTSNLDLIVFSVYQQITKDIMTIKAAIEQNQGPLSINISNFYEAGDIDSDTGRFNVYVTANMQTGKRIGKYLRVVTGSQVSINSYASGNVYCYQYDAQKQYIGYFKMTSGGTFNLDSSAEWLRFDHTNYAGETITVNISSPSRFPEWGFCPRDSGDTIAFGYEVFPSYHTDTPADVSTLDTAKAYTAGLLMLPPNYTETGEKVPIIYFAHGSNDVTSISSVQFSQMYMDYLHYLRDEGYALFDCYGWTSRYTISGAQMANPTNMAAIKQGLRWAAEHFNIDLDRVYVSGKSLGGLQAINLCYDGDFRVKACCPLAPAFDASEIAFGYTPAARKSYAADVGFSPDTGSVLDETWSGGYLSDASAAFKAYALANADKLIGYNPLYRNLIGVDANEFVQYQIDGQGGYGTKQDLPNKMRTMNRICNVPTKIMIAVDDDSCSPTQCDAYVQSIKNTGGMAEMRWFPAGTGSHHAVDNDPNALKVASITTACGITYADVPLAYAEMVQFFRRYN